MFGSRRRRGSFLAVVLVTLVALLQPAPASAGKPPGGVPDAPLPAPGSTEPTPTELADLAQLARQRGITHQEAIETYGWRARFSELLMRIQEAYPDEYAGAKMAPDDGSGPWVAFRADAPPESVAMLKSFFKPVAVHESRGFSEKELEARLEKAHYALWQRKDLVRNVSSGYDIATGAITVQVEPVASLASLATVQTDLRAALPAESDAWNVQVSVVDSIAHADDYIHGGGRLEYQSSSGLACTAGFGIRKGSNPRGMTTASHCNNALDYSWIDAGAPWTRLTFQAEHNGTWGDVQWHTSTNQVDDDFYQNWYSLRDTNAVGYAQDNQAVCLFGHTTGQTCDVVYQRNHCLGNRCHLTLTENHYAKGGDSGGPWFWGNTAYGIHSGSKNYPWTWSARSSFTPVTYLDEALNVQVFMYENCGC